MKVTSKLIVFAWLLSGQSPLLYSINIKLLKGTHDILQGADQYCAPFWGLSFIEEGVAEDLYDLSGRQVAGFVQKLMGSENDSAALEQTRIKVLLNLNETKNTATQNLVESLFYKTAGTFSVTVSRNNPVRLLGAMDIGILLQKIKLRSLYKAMATKLAALKSPDEMFKKMLQDFDFKGTADEGLTSFKSNKDAFIDRIFDQCLKAKLLKDVAGSKPWNQFVTSIKLSLDECDPLNINALYPPNTTQGILLGFMLQKIESKQDLERYFEGFLGSAVRIPSDVYSSQEMKNIVGKPVNFGSMIEFADFLCSAIYLKNYEAILPTIAINKKVVYEGIEFTDCAENAVRNLCNIVTYDQTNKSFGNVLNLGEQLRQFYSNPLFKDVSAVANIATHQAWMELLQNIPGVKYAQIKLENGAISLHKAIDEFDGESFDGFIPMTIIDTSLPARVITIEDKNFTCYEKNIGDKKYLLIPQNLGLHCFELRALLSNIVVLLNNLFDLGLIKDESDIFDENFIKTYFPLVCDHLKLRIGNNINALQEILIDINLYKGDDRFVLQLKSIHVDVFVPSLKAVMPAVPAGVSYLTYPGQIAAYVSLYAVSVARLSGLVGADLKLLARLNSFVDVRFTDAKLFMIDDFVKHGFVTFKHFVGNLLLMLPNPTGCESALKNFLELVEKGNNLQVLKEFLPSYLVMLNVMMVKNGNISKTLPMYISFLQLLGYQSEKNLTAFINAISIALQSYPDDVMAGLRIAKLALKQNLVSKAFGGFELMKPILLCLANHDQAVFNQAVATLVDVEQAGIVTKIELTKFMLGFAKYCVTTDSVLAAINIVSLLVQAGVVRDVDLIKSFNLIKADKNVDAQSRKLITLIDLILGKLNIAVPIRAGAVVETVD